MTASFESPAGRLVGYLGELFEAGSLSKPELLKFLEALERDRLSNPISEEDAEVDSRLERSAPG